MSTPLPKSKPNLDYCCTSSNAVNVVKAIPADKEILFLPDMFLGSYVAKMTGRKNMRISGPVNAMFMLE